MLERLHIKNYRSIAEAEVPLRPFTVLLGANGSGKSNLLQLLADLGGLRRHDGSENLRRHRLLLTAPSAIELKSTLRPVTFKINHGTGSEVVPELTRVRVFSIDPRFVGASEALVHSPEVEPNGAGTVQVLDALKTGDREDLFRTIERRLREFVPEIEKLSFAPGANAKSLQVREAGIPTPVPVSELSEGTRLVLTLLTIVYQERKPSLIGLEDIDRGLHPALFGKVVEVCRELVSGPDAPQIIATTHNPYFVDQFIDDEDSVVLVEKTDARTTFTALSERLRALGERGEDTLGGVWYSGLLGGTPKRAPQHLPDRPAAAR